MSDKRLIILNPNASQDVTAGLDRIVSPLRAAGVALDCVTSHKAPKAIESHADVEAAVPAMLEIASATDPHALGYVIACYSDPGLAALRAQTTVPVIGIREASVASAMTVGERFGVIAILPASVERQHTAFTEMGVTARWAGSRALNLGVADLAVPDRASQRIVEVARELRDIDGADVLILGCAGMGHYKTLVEQEVGLPVIEPTQAAVAMALGHVLTR